MSKIRYCVYDPANGKWSYTQFQGGGYTNAFDNNDSIESFCKRYYDEATYPWWGLGKGYEFYYQEVDE